MVMIREGLVRVAGSTTRVAACETGDQAGGRDATWSMLRTAPRPSAGLRPRPRSPSPPRPDCRRLGIRRAGEPAAAPAVLANLVREFLGLLWRVRLLAQQLARLLHVHLDLVRRVLDPVAPHHLAQVLALVDNLGRPAKRQVIPLVRKLRLGGVDGRDPGQVEAGCGRRQQREHRKPEGKLAERARNNPRQHARRRPPRAHDWRWRPANGTRLFRTAGCCFRLGGSGARSARCSGPDGKHERHGLADRGAQAWLEAARLHHPTQASPA
eukprot:scaffold19009_cov98-Isochrysis_galbana.AAC.2